MAVALQTLRLRIEAPPGASTVGWVAEALTSLDYAYNLGAVIAYADEGHVYSEEYFGAVYRVLEGASEAGTYAANFALSSILRDEARLHYEELRSGSALEINVNGVAESITALRDTFDPEERKYRKERHRQEEASGALAHAIAHAGALADLIDRAANMRRNLRDVMPDEKADRLVEVWLTQAVRAVQAVNRNDVKVVEGPTDLP